MKTIEILSKLDLTKKESYYIKDDFLSQFDIQEYDIDLDKISDTFTCIRIITWYCTDRWVGTLVILLNDVPICISSQIGRKCDEKFEWISKEAYLQVRELLEKARIIREKEITIIDPIEEFGDTYEIGFTNQMIPHIHAHGMYKNQRVSVKPIKSNDYLEKRVNITFNDDRTETIPLENVSFPLLGLISEVV